MNKHLLTSREYLSALLRSCLTFSSVCLSVCLSRLARHSQGSPGTLCWRTVRFVYNTLQMCCAWFACLTSTTPPICTGSSCMLPSCSGDQPESGCNHASRVLLRPPGVRPAEASRAEISAPALLPQPPLRWPCVSRSVDTTRRRHACLIDRSACLMEPRTCDWHTKCSRLTVRSRFPSCAPSWALCAAQFWYRPLTYSVWIFLDDLFLSLRFQLGPSATRCHSFLL